MKSLIAIALAAAVLASVPSTVIAAPAKGKTKTAHKAAKVAHKPKTATAAKYECVKCHMVYSAADAKKDHYKCEMDGGKLVAVKSGKKKAM